MKIDVYNISIPDDFIGKIRRFFGSEGAAWLAGLDARLHQCIAKWHLTDCHLANNLSVNLVCFATSPDYGPVVLKIGVPHPELHTEVTALSLYQGQNICACYDSDVELGAMLLERVMPGYNLKTLQDESACLEVAVDVIVNLPIPVQGTPPLPSFSDWIERAFSRARREQKVSRRMLSFVDQAERLFHEITALEPAHVLLHGDLHHENILYSETGQWKASDPKGAIGFPCIECARFIQNQLAIVDAGDRTRSLQKMVAAFGVAFDRPKRTIAICAFIDCVLSRCWTFEDYLSPDAFTEAEVEALSSAAFYLDFIDEITTDRELHNVRRTAAYSLTSLA